MKASPSGSARSASAMATAMVVAVVLVVPVVLAVVLALVLVLELQRWGAVPQVGGKGGQQGRARCSYRPTISPAVSS